MVVLAVTWIANPGKEEEVADAFRKLEAAARQEPGCLRFVVHRHRTDPARFFVYEQYRDDAALAAHRETKHFQQYVLKTLPPLGVRREGEVYTLLTGD
ncbi:MAG TPA: putative quinol monooxygenase [Terriglobales bacterium]